MQEQQQQEQQEILLRFKLHVITLFSHPHGENKAFKRSKVTTSHSGPAAGSGKKLSIIRDGPLENLWGGGGVQKIQKKKLNEKNSCTPSNPKKYLCYGLKKIHTMNLITKKIPPARKFPSLP